MGETGTIWWISCAVVGVLVIDPDGVYDPRLVNDRLLLGLKGTMSEYELNLLRQRGLAARDSKAQRGELRFSLPPGYYWNDVDQIEVDPNERVRETIKLMFRKFRELGSARQLFLMGQRRRDQIAGGSTECQASEARLADAGLSQPR